MHWRSLVTLKVHSTENWMSTDLDLWCGYRLGETKERQSEVDETVLVHVETLVTLNQLCTHNRQHQIKDYSICMALQWSQLRATEHHLPYGITCRTVCRQKWVSRSVGHTQITSDQWLKGYRSPVSITSPEPISELQSISCHIGSHLTPSTGECALLEPKPDWSLLDLPNPTCANRIKGEVNLDG